MSIVLTARAKTVSKVHSLCKQQSLKPVKRDWQCWPNATVILAHAKMKAGWYVNKVMTRNMLTCLSVIPSCSELVHVIHSTGHLCRQGWLQVKLEECHCRYYFHPVWISQFPPHQIYLWDSLLRPKLAHHHMLPHLSAECELLYQNGRHHCALDDHLCHLALECWCEFALAALILTLFWASWNLSAPACKLLSNFLLRSLRRRKLKQMDSSNALFTSDCVVLISGNLSHELYIWHQLLRCTSTIIMTELERKIRFQMRYVQWGTLLWQLTTTDYYQYVHMHISRQIDFQVRTHLLFVERNPNESPWLRVEDNSQWA